MGLARLTALIPLWSWKISWFFLFGLPFQKSFHLLSYHFLCSVLTWLTTLRLKWTKGQKRETNQENYVFWETRRKNHDTLKVKTKTLSKKFPKKRYLYLGKLYFTPWTIGHVHFNSYILKIYKSTLWTFRKYAF